MSRSVPILLLVALAGCFEPLDIGGLLDGGDGGEAAASDSPALDAGPAIHLRIVDDRPHALREPVAGARIVVRIDGTRHDTVAGSDGVARVPVVPTEPFDLTVYSPGFTLLSAFDLPPLAEGDTMDIGLGSAVRCELRSCGRGELSIAGRIERTLATSEVIVSAPSGRTSSTSGGFVLIVDDHVAHPISLFGIELRRRAGRTDLVAAGFTTVDTAAGIEPTLVMEASVHARRSARIERRTPGPLAGPPTTLWVATEDAYGEPVHTLGAESVPNEAITVLEVPYAPVDGAEPVLWAAVTADLVASHGRAREGETLVIEEPPAAHDETREWDLLSDEIPIAAPEWADVCSLVVADRRALWDWRIGPERTTVRAPLLPEGVRLRDVVPVRIPVPFGLVCFRLEVPVTAAQSLTPGLLTEQAASWAWNLRARGIINE